MKKCISLLTAMDVEHCFVLLHHGVVITRWSLQNQLHLTFTHLPNLIAGNTVPLSFRENLQWNTLHVTESILAQK